MTETCFLCFSMVVCVFESIISKAFKYFIGLFTKFMNLFRFCLHSLFPTRGTFVGLDICYPGFLSNKDTGDFVAYNFLHFSPVMEMKMIIDLATVVV